jgi:hypothetical protein
MAAKKKVMLSIYIIQEALFLLFENIPIEYVRLVVTL